MIASLAQLLKVLVADKVSGEHHSARHPSMHFELLVGMSQAKDFCFSVLQLSPSCQASVLHAMIWAAYSIATLHVGSVNIAIFLCRSSQFWSAANQLRLVTQSAQTDSSRAIDQDHRRCCHATSSSIPQQHQSSVEFHVPSHLWSRFKACHSRSVIRLAAGSSHLSCRPASW